MHAVQGHSRSRTSRKPVCDFLFVSNINRHPISYRFEVIADYCSNLGLKRFDRRTDRFLMAIFILPCLGMCIVPLSFSLCRDLLHLTPLAPPPPVQVVVNRPKKICCKSRPFGDPPAIASVF